MNDDNRSDGATADDGPEAVEALKRINAVYRRLKAAQAVYLKASDQFDRAKEAKKSAHESLEDARSDVEIALGLEYEELPLFRRPEAEEGQESP